MSTEVGGQGSEIATPLPASGSLFPHPVEFRHGNHQLLLRYGFCFFIFAYFTPLGNKLPLQGNPLHFLLPSLTALLSSA